MNRRVDNRDRSRNKCHLGNSCRESGTNRDARAVVSVMRVMGERFTSTDRQSAPASEGRVCQDPGCSTRLSIYNDMDFCSLHAPMVVPRMRGKVFDD